MRIKILVEAKSRIVDVDNSKWCKMSDKEKEDFCTEYANENGLYSIGWVEKE